MGLLSSQPHDSPAFSAERCSGDRGDGASESTWPPTPLGHRRSRGSLDGGPLTPPPPRLGGWSRMIVGVSPTIALWLWCQNRYLALRFSIVARRLRLLSSENTWTTIQMTQAMKRGACRGKRGANTTLKRPTIMPGGPE